MKWMYNILTGGKTEMLPFRWILPFRKKKKEREEGGRAQILWKTRFLFDCVGAQRRQDVYCTCKESSPPLLWDWINARFRLLPGVSWAKMQWLLIWLFLLVWGTTVRGEKKGGDWTFPLCNLFLPLFSLLRRFLSALWLSVIATIRCRIK